MVLSISAFNIPLTGCVCDMSSFHFSHQRGLPKISASIKSYMFEDISNFSFILIN